MPLATKKPRRMRGEEDEEYVEDADSMEDMELESKIGGKGGEYFLWIVAQNLAS